MHRQKDEWEQIFTDCGETNRDLLRLTENTVAVAQFGQIIIWQEQDGKWAAKRTIKTGYTGRMILYNGRLAATDGVSIKLFPLE